MMIRANGSYLDYDGDLVIEKQSKLFKDISLVAGNYSYADTLPLTSNNKEILGLEMSNQDKIIYGNIPGEVLTDSGELIYIGSIRIDSIVGYVINFTFLSGNSDWINLLGNDQVINNILNLDLKDFEIDISFPGSVFGGATEIDHIVNRFGKTSGIVYPLVDRGGLQTRGFRRLRVGDFQPFLFLKTIMDRIFVQSGLKLQGPLLNDPLYANAIITGNNLTVEQKQIDNRKVFAGLQVSQSFTGLTTINLTTGFTNTLFNRVYTNSVNANFDSTTHKYNVDARMYLRIYGNGAYSNVGDSVRVSVFQNGVTSQNIQYPANIYNFSFDYYFYAVPGDVFWVTIQRVVGAAAISITEANIYFEPQKIYHLYPASLLNSMPFVDFVGDVFRMFNVVPSYNGFTKTVTAELFKNIKNNIPVDISQYIESIDQRFSEDVNSYSKQNILELNASSTEEIGKYNTLNKIPYGAGQLTIHNFYLQAKSSMVTLKKFVAPYVYFNTVFGCWLPKLPFVKIEQANATNASNTVLTQPFKVTSVSENSDVPGTAIFNSSDYANNSGSGTGIIQENLASWRLIRILTNNNSYNFDWPVFHFPPYANQYSTDCPFGITVTGTIQWMDIKEQSTNEMVILSLIPASQVRSFSSFNDIGIGAGIDGSTVIDNTMYTVFDFAYFLPPPNMNIQETLAFGLPNGFTGLSATDNYYRETGDILNDPVKYTARCYLPEKIFRTLDPTLPVRIKTKEHNSLCYLNRITGYKGSLIPCDVELMKF